MSRAWIRLIGVVVAGLAGLAPARQAAQLTGRVETRVRNGVAAATAVVYAEPMSGVTPSRPVTVTLTQKNKAFTPRVLGLPIGSTIEFPNTDEIFHNVFSLSPPQPFDLGLYRSGASKARVFGVPAAYHVFCNIHPQMVAFVVIAPTPYVTTVAPDGTWRLDLPAGRYRVTALSERAAPSVLDARTDAPEPLILKLDESIAVQETHLDKFGKAYPASAYRGGN